MAELANKTKRSFSTIELLIAVSIFSIISTTIFSVLIHGKRTSKEAINQNKANYLAQEGLEVARNMRDSNPASLSAGEYGLSLVNNTWSLISSPDLTDGFTRKIIISTAPQLVIVPCINTSGTSGENVNFFVLVEKPNTIKFENLNEGLGENMQCETIFIEITAQNVTQPVSIEVKASNQKTSGTITNPCEQFASSLGFQVTLVSVQDNIYRFSLISLSNRYALGYVKFDFGANASVTNPTHQQTISIPRTPSGQALECVPGEGEGGVGALSKKIISEVSWTNQYDQLRKIQQEVNLLQWK